jgi:Skp family chaperone for outer membrane proteins
MAARMLFYSLLTVLMVNNVRCSQPALADDAAKLFPNDAAASPAQTPSSTSPAPAPAASTVAVVDRDKVVRAWPKAVAINRELERGESEVKKIVDEGNASYEAAKKQGTSAADLAQMQRTIQAKIDSAVNSVKSLAEAGEAELEQKLDKAIKEETAARGFSSFKVKPDWTGPGVDISDGVLKRLNQQ